ncbi:MAG: hypothetical protein IAG13_03740 [Deltaproteobacteria bacterium]|nr:hypothetical protein [Nannocystaceae bacterium]
MSDPEKRPRLKQHPIVEKLIDDPNAPPDVVQIVGYIGKSPRQAHHRVYLSLQFDEYVDVPEDAIVHFEEVPDTEMQHGGTRLWVQASAPVVHETRQTTRTEARFLEGSIADEYLQDMPAEPDMNAGGGEQFGYPPQTAHYDCSVRDGCFGMMPQTKVTQCECPMSERCVDGAFGTPVTRVTCPTRCLRTCGPTCLQRTCGRTCLQLTCGVTCVQTCRQTCGFTCQRTCGPTCFGLCPPQTQNTCGIACTRICTQGLPCTEPRTRFCPRTQVCPGPVETRACPIVTQAVCPRPTIACPTGAVCNPGGFPGGGPVDPAFGASYGSGDAGGYGYGQQGGWGPDAWPGWYGRNPYDPWGM